MNCRRLTVTFAVCLSIFLFSSVGSAAEPHYVGSAACKGCHAAEYANFIKYSKKAHSGKSIRRMARHLKPAELRGCYGCHTTGYGKPGGFVSFARTPDMADDGCEVCHGPGSAHIDSGGRADLIRGRGRVSLEDCERCHNSERVANFRFKPMLYGGAH